MFLRACAYKNCENYTNVKDKTYNDVKLFSFPKNPERRQKWIELGKVHPNLPETMYFFCSDHFDKKYLSINNRRTILLGEAVPFPCVETEIEETNENVEDELDYYTCKANKRNSAAENHEVIEEQDLIVESTTMIAKVESNFYDEEDSNILDMDDDGDNEVILFANHDNNHENYSINCNSKRKLDNITIQATSSKSKLLKISPPRKTLRKSTENTITAQTSPNKAKLISVPGEKTDEDYSSTDQLIDAEHVATFIFKGEEYVQMPKEHYVNEKIELMKKIRKMESVVKAIQKQLNYLDD